MAAYHGRPEPARALILAGADPEPVNDRGQTPLATAGFKRSPPVMHLLLDRGAAVDGRADGGRNPLMIAAMFNRVEAVQLLLANDADPAAHDAGGLTARAAAEVMGVPDTSGQIDRAIFQVDPPATARVLLRPQQHYAAAPVVDFLSVAHSDLHFSQGSPSLNGQQPTSGQS
jgi:ankyrin repeat protein